MELQIQKKNLKGSETKKKNINEISIEQNINENEFENKDDTEEAGYPILPDLKNLEKIQNVHQQEIELFSSILKDLKNSKQKENNWNKIMMYFKIKSEARNSNPENSKSKRGSKKKYNEKNSKQSKSTNQNNVSGFNSSLNGRFNISEDFQNQGRICFNYLMKRR
jgi:hypothetical protein